ncbi:MAG: SAM-dependent methyltransferase, partial [Planctomycetota bacterium]
MRQRVIGPVGFRRVVGLIVLLAIPAQVSAGQAKRGITGDWQVKVDFDGRQMTSILSLSNDAEGKLKGEWISFLGLSELSDITHEGNALSFVQVNRFRERQSKTKFAGTVRRGKLSGTLSSDRGEYKAEGTRVRRMPTAAGNWEAKLTMGEREFTAVLTVKANEKAGLSADWKSQWGEHEISNVQFKAGKLTFDRKSKIQDRQWESSFEGKVKGQTLTGVIKSERGDIAVEAKRSGAALVGRWELEIESDSGGSPGDSSRRKQLLRVNPDLSAMYGPIAIEKIELDNGDVAFKTALEFGERRYEMSFAGLLKGRKLTGQLTTSRGTRTVTGTKRALRPGRQKSSQIKKASRKPDVIFVPTPQEVVDKMLELAEVKQDDLVYDLGCGDGRIVVTAAKKYGCRGVGYDIAPKRVRESRQNVQKNNVGHLVRIEQADIFTLDLSKANVITLYLLPSLNVKLIPQLEKLRPGSRIVSHDFDMQGVKPDKVVEMTSDDDYEGHTVYLWTTPLKKE